MHAAVNAGAKRRRGGARTRRAAPSRSRDDLRRERPLEALLMDQTSAPRRVLLAGGGTAGHTSPLLATADALRRRDPEIEITALGTARGLETRVIPEAGYPLELIPPVPLPRRVGSRPAAHARSAARGDEGGARGDRPDPARRGRGLRRLRLGAGLPRGPQAPAAPRRARGQRAAGDRQQAGRPVHHPRRDQLPRHRAAARALHRPADPPDDQHPRPGGAAGRGARVLRPRRRPADAAGDRWVPGRAPAEPVRRRGRAGVRRGRGPGAAHRRPARARPPRRSRPAGRRTSWCRS